MLKKIKYLYFSRIDIKISITVAIFTVLTSLVLSAYYYTMMVKSVELSIEKRVESLYSVCVEKIDLEIFETMNSLTDMKKDEYEIVFESLQEIKRITDIDFLYTAKLDESGNVIYIVDVVESGRAVRFPGDQVDKEILDIAYMALSGENVLIEPIYKNFQDLYVSILPVYDENNKVIGIIGIEIDQNKELYTVTQSIKILPFIILLLVIINYSLSMWLFSRLKNPLFIEEKTKDMLTGFKNLNVFEVDLLNVRPEVLENKGIVVISINGLNDVITRLGQISGDNYVNLVTGMMLEEKSSTTRAYRTDNHEFVLLSECDTLDELKEFTIKFTEKVRNQDIYKDIRCSIAGGYSIYDRNLDENLGDTHSRAVGVLKANQKRQYEKMER